MSIFSGDGVKSFHIFPRKIISDTKAEMKIGRAEGEKVDDK
jgi:hypothetical protein